MSMEFCFAWKMMRISFLKRRQRVSLIGITIGIHRSDLLPQTSPHQLKLARVLYRVSIDGWTGGRSKQTDGWMNGWLAGWLVAWMTAVSGGGIAHTLSRSFATSTVTLMQVDGTKCDCRFNDKFILCLVAFPPSATLAFGGPKSTYNEEEKEQYPLSK